MKSVKMILSTIIVTLGFSSVSHAMTMVPIHGYVNGVTKETIKMKVETNKSFQHFEIARNKLPRDIDNKLSRANGAKKEGWYRVPHRSIASFKIVPKNK